MKSVPTILIVVAIVAFAATARAANFNGSDDFSGASKDANRWGPDVIGGAGALTQTNGRLEFTTGSVPTGSDLAVWPWVLNYGSYTQSWAVQIDATVLHLGLSNNQNLAFGLSVYPTAANTNFFAAGMRLESSSPEDREFSASVGFNGATTTSTPVGRQPTAATTAAVRIEFNASTSVLSAYYDENGPICGYSWTLLGATNVPASWNMTSDSTFGVAVYGNSQGGAGLSPGSVFGDNFCASSGPLPRLGIRLAGGGVVLSWPTNAPACHLELGTTLTPTVCWQVSTNASTVVGTNFTITNTISSGSAFFRLSR